jgi:hypothetical protein
VILLSLTWKTEIPGGGASTILSAGPTTQHERNAEAPDQRKLLIHLVNLSTATLLS